MATTNKIPGQGATTQPPPADTTSSALTTNPAGTMQPLAPATVPPNSGFPVGQPTGPGAVPTGMSAISTGTGAGVAVGGAVGTSMTTGATITALEGANAQQDMLAMFQMKAMIQAAIRAMIIQLIRDMTRDAKQAVADLGEASKKP